jgi:signal peptide peptidase SppA
VENHLALTDACGPILALAQDRLPQAVAMAAGTIKAARNAASNERRSVALIDVQGIITQRPTYWSVSTQEIGALFDKAVNSPNVGTIVISWDSPGGTVYGVKALGDRIYAARSRKRIISHVNSMAASAAYWLASAAHEVVSAPHGDVGSIGVYALHEDISGALDKAGIKTTLVAAGRHKVEGNPFEALSADGKQEMQRRVDALYNAFVSDVARNRGFTIATVRAGFGQGRLVQAENAIRGGMIDKVMPLDDLVARLGAGDYSNARAREVRLAEMDASLRADRVREMQRYSLN